MPICTRQPFFHCSKSLRLSKRKPGKPDGEPRQDDGHDGDGHGSARAHGDQADSRITRRPLSYSQADRLTAAQCGLP